MVWSIRAYVRNGASEPKTRLSVVTRFSFMVGENNPGLGDVFRLSRYVRYFRNCDFNFVHLLAMLGAFIKKGLFQSATVNFLMVCQINLWL